MGKKISILILPILFCYPFFAKAKEINLPYVIMITIDGFSHKYIDQFHPPFLSYLKRNFTYAKSLIPVFPSSTAPNWYSIATGVYPEKHGILSNKFFNPQNKLSYSLMNETTFDSQWYLAKPIWAYLKEFGINSGVYSWVGVDIKPSSWPPKFFVNYNDADSGQKKADTIFKWLNLDKTERPHFLSLYYDIVDKNGHKYGPNSEKVQDAILQVDRDIHYLFQITQGLKLPINFIIVSDHGMVSNQDLQFICLENVLPKLIENNIHYTENDYGFLQFFTTDRNLISEKKHFDNFYLYAKENVPANLHLTNSPLLGNFVAVPKKGYAFAKMGKCSESKSKTNIFGLHGLNPNIEKNVHGIFMALGPNIKGKVILESFRNIHIFPFICRLFGIPIPNQEIIDGDINVLSGIHKKNLK